MTNSNKLIFFLSVSGVGFPYAFYFMLPAATRLSDSSLYAAVAAVALSGYTTTTTYATSSSSETLFLDQGVSLVSSVVTRGVYCNSLFFVTLFNLASLSFMFLAFYFLFNFFIDKKSSFFFFKFYKFLKFNLFLNLPFLEIVDALSFFFFFIFALYFSEIHFFFCNLSTMASDTNVYQINFLMLSFSVIFFLKFFKLATNQGLFFFVSFNLNTAFAFTAGAIKKKMGRPGKKAAAFRSSAVYMFANKTFLFSASAFIFLFFFASTFFIWALRYAIQFIRLVVLFMIHTVFELVVVNSDFVLSKGSVFSFFFFKWIFLIFLLFWGFVYLLTYLNLMLTLQVFIFYFFSEVFQSNFLFDLSATVSARFLKS